MFNYVLFSALCGTDLPLQNTVVGGRRGREWWRRKKEGNLEPIFIAVQRYFTPPSPPWDAWDSFVHFTAPPPPTPHPLLVVRSTLPPPSHPDLPCH